MSGNITEIKALADVSFRYDGMIIGLDGVMFNSNGVIYADAMRAIKDLRSQGKKIVFLSNSVQRAKDIAIKIDRIGISRDAYDGILTSGEILYHDLQNKSDPFFKNIGHKYFYIGNNQDRLIFETSEFEWVSTLSEADFIIVGGASDRDDEINNYIPLFQQALVKSLPMLCADPDRVKMAHGNIPMMGSGYIVEKYARMGGKVFFRGKPQNDVFAYCIEGMAPVTKDRIVVIGDGFETDILGGYNAGLATVFVSCGVHSRELRVMTEEDFDIRRVETFATNFGVKPDYAMAFVK